MLEIVLGPDVTLVSSADETARTLVRTLHAHDLLRDDTAPPAPHRFLATGDPNPSPAWAAGSWAGDRVGRGPRERRTPVRLTATGCGCPPATTAGPAPCRRGAG